MRRRKLEASTPHAQAAPEGGNVLEPTEASALYLLARVQSLGPPEDASARERVKAGASALQAALRTPFAKDVARAIRGARDVPPDAREHAAALLDRAALKV